MGASKTVSVWFTCLGAALALVACGDDEATHGTGATGPDGGAGSGATGPDGDSGAAAAGGADADGGAGTSAAGGADAGGGAGGTGGSADAGLEASSGAGGTAGEGGSAGSTGGAAGAAGQTELVVYDLNRAVTTADRGFPKVEPIAKPSSNIEAMLPGSNGDWTSPINYAGGTLYMRVQVRAQPEPQSMRLQFCMWQYDFTLENCASLASVMGEPGTEETWSQPVADMWKKDGKPMDWKNPRQRYGVAIKNAAGLPVSDYSGWNWNGEDPADWYPLDMRFTVVVVPEGGTFSGWENY